LSTNSRTRPDNLQDYWDARRSRVQAAVDSGQCRIYKAHTGNSIHVASPYNKDFIAGARQLRGGHWLARERAWSFHFEAWLAVVDLCRRVYGHSKVVGLLPPNK
jgi:hypothetical protein